MYSSVVALQMFLLPFLSRRLHNTSAGRTTASTHARAAATQQESLLLLVAAVFCSRKQKHAWDRHSRQTILLRLLKALCSLEFRNLSWYVARLARAQPSRLRLRARFDSEFLGPVPSWQPRSETLHVCMCVRTLSEERYHTIYIIEVHGDIFTSCLFAIQRPTSSDSRRCVV